MANNNALKKGKRNWETAEWNNRLSLTPIEVSDPGTTLKCCLEHVGNGREVQDYHTTALSCAFLIDEEQSRLPFEEKCTLIGCIRTRRKYFFRRVGLRQRPKRGGRGKCNFLPSITRSR